MNNVNKCPHCNKAYFDIGNDKCPHCNKKPSDYKMDCPDFLKEIFGGFGKGK